LHVLYIEKTELGNRKISEPVKEIP